VRAARVAHPATIVAEDSAELADAVQQFPDFVARPAFSRGMVYLTNHGPRAGESRLEDCSPISDNPWFTGHIGFDYRRTDDDLVMIECNPRSSAGAFFPPGEWLVEAMVG